MDLKKQRWLVLIASMIINICIGAAYAWSVFNNPLVQKFGWTPAATALTFTIATGVGPLMMIFGGGLQDKFGPKWIIFAGGIMFGGGFILSSFTKSLPWLYFSYGIIAGFGNSMIYGCTIANTVKFFPDKRGLVSGLATGGFGMGAVIFAPVFQKIIEATDVLSTFRIIGLLYLVIILVGSQFIKTAPANYIPEGWNPNQNSNNKSSAGTTVDKTWQQMLKDPLFYFLFIMLTFGATSGLMIVSQASSIAQDMVGVTPQAAAVAVSMVAVANTCGRLVWGFVSDKIGRYNAIPMMYLLSACMMLLLTTVKQGQLVLFTISVMLIGFCFGGFMSVFPALTADSFGAKNNGINYGFMFAGGFGIGGIIGPMLAANMKAMNNGDYTMAFIIAAALSIVGIVLTFIAKKKKNEITTAK